MERVRSGRLKTPVFGAGPDRVTTHDAKKQPLTARGLFLIYLLLGE